MQIKRIGVDLAKNAFQLHGADRKTKPSASVGYPVRFLARSNLAGYGGAASPAYVLFNTCGAETKCFADDTKIMESQQAEKSTKQWW